MGTTPQKGNGPVKLQASRRLSSGELMVTTQHLETTLQDIREGDYIVGKKERTTSRIHEVPKAATADQYLPPHQDNPTLYAPQPSTSPDHVALARPSISFMHDQRQSYDSHCSGQTHDSATNGSLTSFYAAFHHHPQDDNLTLRALRRAEYSHLVELYGQEKAAQHLAVLYSQNDRHTSTTTSPTQPPFSPIILDPLPAPPVDGRETECKGVVDTPLSDSCCDALSATSSSHRASVISSCADPSTSTAHTSLVEEDSAGNDIRKLVAQMRSTYLDALEARPLVPTKAKPRKKNRKSKPTPLPIALAESSAPNLTPPSTPGLNQSTWHTDAHTSGASIRRRVDTESTGQLSRLSPIQDSPPHDERDNTGIKRADSSTLGELMADLTRSKIHSRNAGRTLSPSPAAKTRQSVHVAIDSDSEYSHPLTPKSQPRMSHDNWLNIDLKSVEEPMVDSPQEHPMIQHHPVVSSENNDISHLSSRTSQHPDSFGTLYQDLFGRDADDFWSSSFSGYDKDLSTSLRLADSTKGNGSGATPLTSQSRNRAIGVVPENSTTRTRAQPVTSTTGSGTVVKKPPGNFF